MASLEETAKVFQNKFETMIKEITILSLPMQKKSFQCCVSCFDSHKQDPEKIAECINQCHEPSQSFNRVLQREVEGLQTNIESCQKICFNRLAPKLEGASSQTEKTAIEREKDECFVQCFTSNIPIIAEIRDRLKRRI
ncbi:hypothetical protein, conserved [Eimeria tenella]|uniref:Uncharacterized protein n=1 Tax=Eimeria tenella TaxID=5802 RepID=U6L3M7_EIMTE|nr:hypothetical protein, conserved [Eimeria tenella]CDJ43219.1 hypothetical protein, conserved [Eimeria tenella]|eukprot:XP_013233969.1 hypothetical protein, conserved [Eimeria tenella]